MHLLRGDADFGAQAEFATVREPGGRIPIDRRRIHGCKELLRIHLILRHDALRMARAVRVDVLYGLVFVLHRLDADDEVQVLRVPIPIRCRQHGYAARRARIAHDLIATDLHAFVGKLRKQRGIQRTGDGGICQHVLDGVAHARP